MTMIIEDINSKLVQELIFKREQQVIERLAEFGHTFKNKLELEEFAKTRCQIATFPNHQKKLYVDGILVAEWSDKINIQWENNDTKITVTIG